MRAPKQKLSTSRPLRAKQSRPLSRNVRSNRRPIEDVILNLAAKVPEREWVKVPADLSQNVDHYLYGAPKR